MCVTSGPNRFRQIQGWIHPETAISRGAKGTLINHAEHKVSLEHVAMLLDQVPEDFEVCACAAGYRRGEVSGGTCS